jgi:hypothetical protein
MLSSGGFPDKNWLYIKFVGNESDIAECMQEIEDYDVNKRDKLTECQSVALSQWVKWKNSVQEIGVREYIVTRRG